MPATPTESTFELTTIERLKKLGYRYQHGGEIERDLHAVVLEEPLRTQLSRRYRHLPAAAIEQAIQVISTPEGATLDRRNMAFQKLLREGITLRYEVDGEERFEHIYFLDYERPELNDFLVVNQLTIQGGSASSPGNTRRPDVVVYVNGLPLVVFELKSPWDEYADVVGAHHQLGHYTVDIPQLFNFNALCVVSDGNTTLHGLHAAGFEWFAPWKSIDGLTVEPNTTGSMKTLVEGLFPKERLLDYVRNFIVHEVVNEKITKKGAKYHQYFAVRFAVGKTLEAMQPGSDKRVGVVWHTQGSGKSLSMIFLTGILRRWPGLNPTVVVQVDRTDLDNQLYDNFVAAKDLVGTVHQADSVESLRERLQTAGGEVICSTIEKFRLQKKQGELRHPVLSARAQRAGDRRRGPSHPVQPGRWFRLSPAGGPAQRIVHRLHRHADRQRGCQHRPALWRHVARLRHAAGQGGQRRRRHFLRGAAHPVGPGEPEDRRRPGGDCRGAGNRHRSG